MDMRCLIVDDNDRFLETARGVLERDGIVVVGVASDSEHARELIDELRPDVALIDVCLGDECGVELADQVVENAPSKPAVILISTYPEDDFADIVTGSAALGFLPKSELSGPAIRKIVGERSGEPGDVGGHASAHHG
jgi:DNA-binding NarL/FixJ family response regulator